MGFGTSIVLIAAGAILRFAVSVTTTGFNLHSIGLILMIVGALALVLSIAFWSSWGGFGGAGGGLCVRRHRGQRGHIARADIFFKREANTGWPSVGLAPMIRTTSAAFTAAAALGAMVAPASR